MANDEQTKDESPPEPVDPVTAVLQQAQKQAEARKAIAEARLATAKAILPTLPEDLGSTIDVSGAGTEFGTVNCYRAAFECTGPIADEVTPKLGDKPVWIASGPSAQSPMAVLVAVENTLAHLTKRLQDAIALLQAPVGSVPTELPHGPAEETPPAPKPEFVEPATAMALLSAGIPLIAGLFSSKVTMKGGSVELDDDAVVDLLTRALVEKGVKVVRPDPNSPLDDSLRSARDGVRELADDLRRETWRAAVAAQDELEALAPLITERDLRKQKVTALLAASSKDFSPDVTADIDRLVALAPDIARREKAKAILEAKQSEATALVETAEQALDVLYTVGADGFSPLAYASFSKQVAANGPWARLEVTAVSAGSESDYHDRKVRSDYAIHTGSATITYRLHDGTGTVAGAQTFVATASSRVNLNSGEISWAP